MNTLFLRGLYALGRVREAVTASALVFLLNTLGYWLLRDAGLFLLNLSTALAGWVGLFLYLALLRREGVGVGYAPGYLLRVLPAGLLAALPGLGLRERLPRLRAQGGAASPPPGRGRGVALFLFAGALLGLPVKGLWSGGRGPFNPPGSA